MKIDDIVSSRFNRVTFGILPKSLYSYLLLSPFLKWRATDFITFVILGLAYIGIDKLDPFEREFRLDDARIQHSYTEVQQISNTMLFVYSCLIPFLIILVFAPLFNRKQRLYKTYVALLGLILCLVTTGVVTGALKNYIGRHRPDFLNRCLPKDGTATDVYVKAIDVCTSKDESILKDGFRTTPSGHTLLSFAGLHYLTLWLFGQFLVGNPIVGEWRSVLSMIPTLGAGLIGLTRTQDYRHHFVDVFLGMVVGVLIAWWNYFRLFPWYSSEKSYNPKVYTLENQQQQTLPTYAHQDDFVPPQSLIPLTEHSFA